MSSAESPSTGGPESPPVDDNEDLYRALTHNNWWIEEEQRVSSAAFSFPNFSVDIVSIAGSEGHTLARFAPGTGLVIFNCGRARRIGCDARKEIDPAYPDNDAHANAYMPRSGQRKKAAKELADNICRILHKPNISPTARHPDPPGASVAEPPTPS